jgi:hypothetical protein
MADRKLKENEKALMRRYLVWCYKSTKESVDWIDRKFTQTEIDRFVLKRLEKMKVATPSKEDYHKRIADFRIYISDKEKDGVRQKFVDGNPKNLSSEYLYLRNRLAAIEEAIKHFLGPRELARIDLLYQQEMTRRILESKEH